MQERAQKISDKYLYSFYFYFAAENRKKGRNLGTGYQ
jgi:hypothetical protein